MTSLHGRPGTMQGCIFLGDHGLRMGRGKWTRQSGFTLLCSHSVTHLALIAVLRKHSNLVSTVFSGYSNKDHKASSVVEGQNYPPGCST